MIRVSRFYGLIFFLFFHIYLFLGILSGQKKRITTNTCLHAHNRGSSYFFTIERFGRKLAILTSFCANLYFYLSKAFFCKPIILFISSIVFSGLKIYIPSPAVSGQILFESARAVEMPFVCTLSSQK